MNRRIFLKYVRSIPVLSVVWSYLTTLAGAGAPVAVPSVRRVRPSDPSWPTAASWEKLKQQVGGQLIAVSSPLAPCMDAPDSAACATRVEEMKNPYFIGDQAGATQASGWLDAWTLRPAPMLSRPNASGRRRRGQLRPRQQLRLVVKGGGHSYQGASNAPDSLLIWTRAMNQSRCTTPSCPRLRGRAATRRHDREPARVDRRLRRGHHKAGRYVQGGGCNNGGRGRPGPGRRLRPFSKRYGGRRQPAGGRDRHGRRRIRIVNARRSRPLLGAQGRRRRQLRRGDEAGLLADTTTCRSFLAECRDGTIKAINDTAFRELVGRFIEFLTTPIC